jgi:thiol:disulfide interchange protein DsbD
LAVVLVLAFLAGLILNVMPCVLPVISLKVLGFVRQGGEDRGRIARLGLTFAAGVLASFAALGGAVIALDALGAQVGWGFQFQEPRFVILMAAVVFAFGLSLFGVYEIRLPGRAATGLDALARREGYGGAFMNGVLATALATPCTAPFLGTALGFAFAQPPAWIMAFFLTIGAGLAAPYVALSLHPAWLRRLPKPGAWMDTFKQAMGLLLMATLVWLLWVLGRQTGAEGIAAALAFLLALGTGCWLMGMSGRRGGLRALAALALALGGYWFFPERHLRVGGAAPPAQSSGASQSDGGIAWEPFDVRRVEELAAQGRMVFIDFTADWCTTCKVNEKLALETEAVRAAFARHRVAAVKADWTRRDPAIGAVLAQFGRSGVPLYVILPPGRASQPAVLPEAITQGIVTQALDEAARTVAPRAEGGN